MLFGVKKLRMLCIHCDYFSYITTRKTEIAEKADEECKRCAVKDALVIFVTVEKYDEKDVNKIVHKSIEEIQSITKRLGVKEVILFPFAHLSEEIGNPNIAIKILQDLYEQLKKMGYSVCKAPFGWEKIFSLTSKGHPLSESLRIIKP